MRILESLFIKVPGLQACIIKKRLQHMYFPVNSAKFLTALNLKNICERLLLLKINYFAIYCTHSAFIHFTLHVYLHRQWTAFCRFLLVIAPWQEISKATMKWKLAISDQTMITFTQVDSRKCSLLVLSKPAMFICNILYFAKYFAKYSKPYNCYVL